MGFLSPFRISVFVNVILGYLLVARNECDCGPTAIVPIVVPVAPSAGLKVEPQSQFSVQAVQGKPVDALPVRRSFEEIAKRAGTDKVSQHNYGWFYQQHLGPISDDKFVFIEIGFATGKGAAAWREYLQNADVHEFEIGCAPDRIMNNSWITGTAHYKSFLDSGKLHCGSALNYSYAEPIMKSFGDQLKVVVDDGSHGAWAMIDSLNYFFPRIQANGLFFMEDMACSYHAGSAGFVDYSLKPLLDDVNRDPLDAATTRKGPNFPELHPLLKSIHCAQGICVFVRNDHPAVMNATLPPQRT
jgi:hypothetical protein